VLDVNIYRVRVHIVRFFPNVINKFLAAQDMSNIADEAI